MAIVVETIQNGDQLYKVNQTTNTLDVKYRIRGEGATAGLITREEAEAALLAEAPVNYGTMSRRGWNITHQSDCAWSATVKYSSQLTCNIGDTSLSGSTGGGTTNITHALAHVGSYPATGKTATDHKGAINVDEDGVNGVDLRLKSFSFSLKKCFAPGSITDAYLGLLNAATTTVNLLPYRGFAKGELMLVSTTFNVSFTKEEVTYNFEASPNSISLTFPESGISVPFKNGWDYIWFEYELVKDTNSKREVRQAICAHVEQVYQYSNFALLGI